MATTQSTQQDNLFKAYGIFIEAFRPYVVSVLYKEAGDRWPAWFVEALYPQQRDTWNMGLKAGSDPLTLIDYPYLKDFSLKYKQLLRADFGKDANNLPSKLETIYAVRNKMAHFQEISADDITEVFISMKRIAQSLKMTELETELVHLQEAKVEKVASIPAPARHTSGHENLKPWFHVVTPHLDIKQGRLDESIFAANLAEVALGNGREIYNNPVVFFSKTYLTAGLKNIAKTVLGGLNGNEDAENRVISLQTGFGGGKTHTLISLYHLCKWGKKASSSAIVEELLRFTGVPDFNSANIAVFTNTTNDPANGRVTPEGTQIHTIWGEIAYQLGGQSAYEIVRKNDEQLIAPAGLFKKVLEQCTPALILVDELADYCVKASARKAGNSSLADQTISFMQELTEAIAGTNNCVAVITLPASPQEVGNTAEAQAILSSLQKRVSRIGADTQPVAEDEIFEVIRRRLFDDIGSEEEIEAVASKYMETYQQFSSELPNHAVRSQYKQKILQSYPFHPELIDVFRVRWASHHDFQRTRGVLRLLAAIVSDLWKRQQSLPGSNLIIQSGMVNFANLDALTGQLKKLYGNGYDSVIAADVAGTSSNAAKIDSHKTDYGQHNLTQSIASVILLNSFGNDGANKGVSVADIKLNLLNPDGFNHNNVNGALDELESNAYYLYYAQSSGSGKRYWFHTKPNINILINQAKGDVKNDELHGEILKRLKEKSNGVNVFKVLVNPADDIPEQTSPTLIILSPEHSVNPSNINGKTKPFIEKIATKKGNSERIYRNTLIFLICSDMGSSKLQSEVREYLACRKIMAEYQGQLEPEQKEELRKRADESSKQADVAMAIAYSVVAKHSAKDGVRSFSLGQFRNAIDLQINTTIFEELKKEEWLLESIGLNTLRNNNLLPSTGNPVKVKDLYEAFLRFDDKPMIKGKEAVTTSLSRYCNEGHFAVASGNGSHFTRYFFKELIPFFEVSDENYWLIDVNDIPKPEPVVIAPTGPGGEGNGKGNNPVDPESSTNPTPDGEPAVKKIGAISISGKVPLERYTELFGYFISPFAMHGHKIEIEVKFKIKSATNNPLDETKQQYKSAKEAAKQLGLEFEEE